jgi:hypothetical protein
MLMQFDPPLPDTLWQPAVIVLLPVTPSAPLKVMVKDCPTSPAPAAVDCVGGTLTEVMTCAVQLAHVTHCPSTNGLAWAVIPLPNVTTETPPTVATVPVAEAAYVFP